MLTPCVFTSVTRIADLQTTGFDVAELARDRWADGDYIVANLTDKPSLLYRFELTNGRMAEAMEGTPVVGTFGKRAATLESTGDWAAIGDDGSMEALTAAELFGKALSVAPTLPPRLMSLTYSGHVLRDGRKLTMDDFVPPTPQTHFSMPVVLLIGTSMSAGKTTTGRIIVRELKRAGFNVAAAKFTGAGRYRDVLAFRDAGADTIIDFVDAGLPSTVVPPTRFARAMGQMLATIAARGADILVAEAGAASPLEPYNGDTAVRMLGANVCCTVLCASDPYAVVGVREAFEIEPDIVPDIVTGPAANTQAGIDLVRKLTGLEALNLLDHRSIPRLVEILKRRLPYRGS
jgi:Domain of unknown function (DUF1611_C) P-loop domain